MSFKMFFKSIALVLCACFFCVVLFGCDTPPDGPDEKNSTDKTETLPEGQGNEDLPKEPQKLIYPSYLIPDMATVGEEFSFSVACATTPDGSDAVIKYSVRPGRFLPRGLSLSADGILSGTPLDTAKNALAPLTASADGYLSVNTDVYLAIQSPIEYGVTRFEIEYINLPFLYKPGFGAAVVEPVFKPDTIGELGTSNDFYFAYPYSPTVFGYKINSDKAVSNASFYISLSSEIGNISLNNTSFDIRVNGVSIMTTLEVLGGDSYLVPFQRFLVSSNAQLNEGENIIEIEILENNLLAGVQTGGPAIDYIEFGDLGNAVLSWRPVKWLVNALKDLN